MAQHRLICLLAGLMVAGGSFAWLNTTRFVHAPAAYIIEYELEPRPDRPLNRSVPAELRYGANPDESAHGVASVRLDAPNVLPLPPAPQHVIRIERTGRKTDASMDSQVWILRVHADGKFLTPETTGKARVADPAVELLEPGTHASFSGTFQEFQLEFLAHDWSGVVRIQVDNSSPIELDLYRSEHSTYSLRFSAHAVPPGSRAVSVSTPHRAVRRLALHTQDPADRFRVTGLTVQTGDETRRIALPETSPAFTTEWRYQASRSLSATRHPTLTGTHIVIALLLGWGAAAIGARLTAPRIPPRAAIVAVHPALTVTVLVLLIAQAAFWLAAAWPAILTTDSFSVWQQSQSLYIDTWLSHTYVLFVLMARQLWDSPAILSLIQVLLTLAIAAAVFLGLLRRGLRPVAVLPFVFLFALSIPIGAYAMYHTRDTLFSLTGVAIAAVIYFWGWHARYHPPCSPGRPALLALSLLAGCHATVRSEGLLVLGLLPLALWLIARLPLWRVAAFTLVSFGLWYALGTPLLRALRIEPSPFYGLTTKLDPLGAIVSGPYNTDDAARDRTVIEKIVPLDRLQQRHRNIEVFWDGSIDTSKIALEDLKALDRLYAELVRRNPGKFLANRWDNFARLCCSRDQFNIGGLLNLGYGPQMNAHMREMGLNEHATTPFPPLRDWLRRLLSASLRAGQSPIDWRSIFWNLWPAVMLTIAAILAFRWIPVTATAALLVGFRIAVIFAAAPASMFKYLYDVYFLGFFLVPMALLELGSRDPRLARLFMRRTAP